MRRTVLAPLAALSILAVAAARPVRAQEPRAHVGRTTRAWVDSTRRAWQGPGLRPLRTTIWYPTDDSVRSVDWLRGPPDTPFFRLGASTPGAPIARAAHRYPLIAVSHGNGGSAGMLGWLGETLASAGYVVVGIDHHGNTSTEAEHAAAGFTLWWERATDVSVVIDRMLADSAFGPRIGPSAIGVAGFALGGHTAMALAGARTSVATWKAFCRSAARTADDGFCEPQPEFPDAAQAFEKVRGDSVVAASLARESSSFRDARVRAVYLIAPLARMFTEASLRTVRLPVRIVVGSADHTAPAATNGKFLAARLSNARLRLVSGAGHYTFVGECEPAGAANFPELCHELPQVDRGAMHRLVADDAVRFFDRVLARARGRAPVR